MFRLKKRLKTLVKRLIRNKAVVLVYHRIAEPMSDIWGIAVSPNNFESHLQILKSNYNVVPLNELVDNIYKKKIKRNTVAITFDDGYVDNYLVAKPLLEKYNLPATFFIASGYLDNGREFWWDRLESLLLYTEKLPASLRIEINKQVFEFDLDGETQLTDNIRLQHIAWNANEISPPTLRAKMFYQIWESLKIASPVEQADKLNELISWSGSIYKMNPNNMCMSAKQLKALSENPLFTIGAHTVSHPALGSHPSDFQKQELSQNKLDLKEITGYDINLAAFPYGNFNEETVRVLKELKFKAGFSTAERPVFKYSDPMRIARYYVYNINEAQFRFNLKHWIK